MATEQFCLLAATLFLWAFTGCRLEDDFAFDVAQEETPDALSPNAPPPHPSVTPVQRLWGIPDTVTFAGKLFHLRIPQDAFKGSIDHYEALGPHGSSLPPWLFFDGSSGVFEGVPNVEDEGELYITVRAVGSQAQDWAKDVFSLEVVRRSSAASEDVESLEHKRKMACKGGEYPTVFSIMLDSQLNNVKPKQRIAAIKNLAGFLGLDHSIFVLRMLSPKENLRLGDKVLSAGPGNVRGRKGRSAVLLQWQVGCGSHIWKQHSVLVKRLEHQARDGTLAEVLQMPVVGWHIKTDKPHRTRREIHGSGDGPLEYEYDEDIYDDEGGDDEDDDVESETEVSPATHIVPTMASPAFSEPTTSHHHRHHHGEEAVESGFTDDTESLPSSSSIYRVPTSPILYGTIMSTPILVPVRPTHLLSSEVLIEPTRVYEDYGMLTPSATPVFITETESSTTSEMPTTQVTEPLPPSSSSGGSSETGPDEESEASSSTGSTSSSTTTEAVPSTEEPTTVPPPPLPPISTTSETYVPRIIEGDETIEFDTKNISPEIEHRLPRLAATAGKSFRFQIPENTFSDLEEGTTRSLRLIFKSADGTSISQSNWIQFNPELQEVYGLPLEEHVSRWTYTVEAMDKEGKSVADEMEVVVQQHKAHRAVNHEFSIQLHLEEKYNFPSVVDWELRVMDSVARLFGDRDDSLITVRSVNTTMDPYVFTWTNDTLPRTPCPKEDIQNMFKVLSSNDDGHPSTALIEALAPTIRVKKVTVKGYLQCENVIIPEVSNVTAALPTPGLRDNFPPTFRNQVDRLNAMVGELLVYSVPEDTCYDPEQLHTRNLKLSLLTKHRAVIKHDHWLQFDVKNQEFYGIPSPEDVGRVEYHLVCEDREGATTSDGLEIVVHPAPKVQYSVEFSMTLNVSYNNFSKTPKMKRRFVEELCDLFHEQNKSAVLLGRISEGSTVVSWYNRSLPIDYCPEEEISRLRKILQMDEKQQPTNLLSPVFPVLKVDIIPVGVCQGGLTPTHLPEVPAPPVDDTQPMGTSTNEEYLITYIIPAVIIAILLLLAGIVACVLYRRRRRGKLSVGDEDERQSFQNKGIPVIFQDELDEKPEPANKSPVIMKDEKPPLPPPEYRRDGDCETPPTPAHPLLGDTDDTPYQPPPPVAGNRDSGRQGRPKPTPTYRKPPPYVPP